MTFSGGNQTASCTEAMEAISHPNSFFILNHAEVIYVE